MNLICRLGRHLPAALPRWNDGFYFATCARCGCNLVRTAFEPWHVPKGFRVVWSNQPPQPRPEVALVRSGAPTPGAPQPAAAAPLVAKDAAAPGPVAPDPLGPQAIAAEPAETVAASAAPIEPPAASAQPRADLGDRPEGDEPADPAPPAEAGLDPPLETIGHAAPPEPPVGAPAPRRPSWDFMDDEPGAAAPAGASPASAGLEAPPTGMAVPPLAAEPPWRWPDFRGFARRAEGLLERAPTPWQSLGLAALVVLFVTAGLYYFAQTRWPEPAGIEAPPEGEAWSSPGSPGRQPGPSVQPSPGTPGAIRTDRAILYVTASLLSCRSAPAEQGERLRNLSRGDEVELIARASPWASISYRGRQCWALERYLSPTQPY